MSIGRFLAFSAAMVCGAISMWGQDAVTPTSITRNYQFAPIGLGSSETTSITVVNTAAASVNPGSSGTTTPAPSCTGTISFSNANGAIGTPTSFTLGSEQFKTVTLAFGSAGLTGNRGEIQGKVSLTISSATATACSLMFSMETYDSGTGATHAVLSSSLASIEPLGPVVPIHPISGPGDR